MFMWTQNQDDLVMRIYGVMRKCKSNLNWSLVLLLTLILMSGCHKTTQKTPFSGHYSSQQIRELWMGCSIAIWKVNPYSQNRIPFCDCSTDATRENYKPEWMRDMNNKKIKELQTVITLKCNKWRMRG